jgi:serine/threonine protein kinase
LKISFPSFSQEANSNTALLLLSKDFNDHLDRLCYSSPEMIDKQLYTKFTDIWSFGCVFYELVCLKRAFDADCPVELAKSISKVYYEPIEKSNPKEFQKILDK